MGSTPHGITQGSIVIAWIVDHKTNKGKNRPAIVLDKLSEIHSDAALTVVSVSATISDPPPDHVVMLPWDPTGRARTGLRKRSGAVCDWVSLVKPGDVKKVKGIAPAEKLEEIIKLVKRLNA